MVLAGGEKPNSKGMMELVPLVTLGPKDTVWF